MKNIFKKLKLKFLNYKIKKGQKRFNKANNNFNDGIKTFLEKIQDILITTEKLNKKWLFKKNLDEDHVTEVK